MCAVGVTTLDPDFAATPAGDDRTSLASRTRPPKGTVAIWVNPSRPVHTRLRHSGSAGRAAAGS
jgi:hypothetical protein